MSHAYDLVVIGSGPAGEKAAVKAAYFNHRVALIERERVFGGAGIQTGTLPSKTLKETALYLSGVYNKGVFSINRELAGNAGIQDFMYRKNLVTQRAANEATEIIHFGLCAVQDKRTLNEVIATVFNYPTLHDLYKYACYDGLGSLAGKKVKKAGEIKR